MDRTVNPTIGDIERAVAERFPTERAEDWDRVGLLAGDPSAAVTGVALALDPNRTTVEAAIAHGANALVTHHPAFLEPPEALRPGFGGAGVVFSALAAGLALINAHTNLDRDSEAQGLLPQRLDLTPIRPLETAPAPLALVTVYVPAESLAAVSAAMVDAGAGRIGDYRGCSFAAPGVGAFTPASESNPTVGEPGKASTAVEDRIEMVCPPALARRVVAAAASAHPYEEPLVTVTDVRIARNSAALGMLCVHDTGGPATLGDLADLARVRFDVVPRVWGDPAWPVDRVATTTGSAGSLIADAISAGVQVLVAGEVRYHDALAAVESGLAILELGHDVTEWPLVGLLEKVVRSVPGLDPARIHVLSDRPRWWTPTN